MNRPAIEHLSMAIAKLGHTMSLLELALDEESRVGTTSSISEDKRNEVCHEQAAADRQKRQ
jgi:hypothetical protein